MEEIHNESSNKMINDMSVLKTIKKSQTYIGNTKNLFQILNNSKKNYIRKIPNNFKFKLNIFEKLKYKKYIDNIKYPVLCEVKINDIYEQGYFKIDNNLLIIMRNKLQELQNTFNNDIDIEKIIDLKKYNNSSSTTDVSTNISLSFYKNKKPIINNCLLYLDFNLITCKLVIHKTKQKFRLLILGKEDNKIIYNNRIIKFKMMNIKMEIFNDICKNINNCILSSNGYKENLIQCSLNRYFCKSYFINYQEFYKFSKTGDILLFRSYSFCGKCQRYITKGNYDHIALLIKYYNELYVYETTGKDGVVARKWYEFIYYYWYLLYDKMTFRKLNVTQDAMKNFIINNNNESILYIGNKSSKYNSGFSDSNVDSLSKIEVERQFYYLLGMKIDIFMQAIKQKKYYFSVWKYLFKSFYKTKKTDNFKKEGYFCSELIAAVYNYCEIISNKINISNYLPSSFAENGDASFNDGFSLGPEHIIIFS